MIGGGTCALGKPAQSPLVDPAENLQIWFGVVVRGEESMRGGGFLGEGDFGC